MKKFTTIMKLAVIAAAVVVTTTPEIKPMAWLIGYY
ncbi:hypothetical protein BJ095_11162 [Ureibacillus chungkukjangi]|uniref:Uncharacterized protein n=1 Tax=Ureibacillus chungkukjangi TaxID=1202712 RepID=A0A318TMY0_9BACL|nr:hypothetical protein BJ095_11162 [Ureibacillus chungkukjangi]